MNNDNRATFTAYFANCPIGGQDWSRLKGGKKVRNRIRLQLGTFEVELIQKPKLVSKVNLPKGRFVRTTRLQIKNLADSERESALEIAEDLMWLLSFATMSQVRQYGWRHGRLTSSSATSGELMFFRPTIQTSGEELRQFLETTWPVYKQVKLSRRVGVAIDYLVYAEIPAQPIEVQLLLAFCALECLKGTFATKEKIPFRGGHFRKSGGKNSDKYSLKELVTKMLREVGMVSDISKAVALRNAIVHSGLSKENPTKTFETYAAVHGLIREYLLRILGYQGSFQDYESMTWKSI